MSRRFSIWVIIAVLFLLSVVIAAYVATDPDPAFVSTAFDELDGPGELVVVDELSFWHSPANSGISYGEFEPLRVRREGAEYFPRTDTDNRFAASGRHYSEIKLTEKDGGVLYLPRWLAYDQADELKMYIRQNSAVGQWRISIYPAADRVAHITENSPAVKVTQSGDWFEISIPLSELEFEPFKREIPERQKARNANFLLSQYNPPAGTVYGLGFSIAGGKPTDSLFVDRIVLKKAMHTKPDKLTGQLKPFVLGAKILLRSDQGETMAKPNWDGSFKIDIPAGAKMIEVIAQTSDKVMSPRSGRFMEVGTYLPGIVIPTDDEVLKKNTLEDDSNTSLYIYENKYGPRIEPDQHFLIQLSIGKDQVVAAELATNRLGYIDRDRRIENPDKAYRVMILGDSHHMGVHLAQADSWWNEAEAVANMYARRPVEFISASFHHASFTSSWPVFRDLAEDLKPDIVFIPIMDPVILNLAVEEFMMRWLGASKGHRPAYQFELGPDGKLVHKPNDPDWQLYREPLPDAEQKRIRAQYASAPYVFANPAQDPEWVKQVIRLSTASLAEFGKLAKQRHTRFAILYISNYGSSKTALFKEDGFTYDPNRFRTLMRTMAKDAGIEFIDIADQIHLSMAGKDISRIYYYGDGHLSSYGHYRYGQALGDMVSSWVKEQ